MSKAFTKESDEEPEEPEINIPPDKNYVTPNGFEQLQSEYRQLLTVDRPKCVEIVRWAAGNGDRSENGDYIYGKKRLREIDRRLRYLTKRLESAEVIDPQKQKGLVKVFFGATVTYLDAEKEHTIKIVGVDEADINLGKISWTSPMAKALLKAAVDDEINLVTPEGKRKIIVLKIFY